MKIMAKKSYICFCTPTPENPSHFLYKIMCNKLDTIFFIIDLQENDHRKQLYDAYCTIKNVNSYNSTMILK